MCIHIYTYIYLSIYTYISVYINIYVLLASSTQSSSLPSLNPFSVQKLLLRAIGLPLCTHTKHCNNTATHCNTLWHAAIQCVENHCSAQCGAQGCLLRYTATYCNTPLHTKNSVQHSLLTTTVARMWAVFLCISSCTLCQKSLSFGCNGFVLLYMCM